MVAWVIIFLAGAALTIWNVFVVFEDYFKYQVDTSISVNKNTVVGEFRLHTLSLSSNKNTIFKIVFKTLKFIYSSKSQP